MDLEYKTVSFEIKDLHEEDDEFFRFSGLASTHDLDRGEDRFEAGAFTESLKTITPVILWVHQMREPIGVLEESKELPNGLFIKARLPKNDTLVSGRVMPQIKVGSVRSMSVGFEPLDVRFETINERRIRVITKANLFEVSPVPIPMNPNAVITDFKNMEEKTVTPFIDLPLADRGQVWSKRVAVASIREHTGSTEKPSASYKKYFMWYDRADAGNFGAYKFPYAQWLDGGFKAVPRAIRAIKGRVGGSNIPAEDKPRVLAHANRYTRKIEAETDGKAFIFEDVRDISDKEGFDRLLKETGLFTKSAREYLAAFLPKRSDSDSKGIEIITGFTKELEEFTKSLKV